MNNDKDILLITLFTFLTVTIWIFFELVKTTKTPTATGTSTEILSSINTNFDIETLNQLKNRVRLE